jgi:hypothetical protein
VVPVNTPAHAGAVAPPTLILFGEDASPALALYGFSIPAAPGTTGPACFFPGAPGDAANEDLEWHVVATDRAELVQIA